ncbi:ABC transporter ATP-binding protein [Clostridium sp.]|uniref:ABC transporter ATP-binding protein n=1 Tax=Clostridium sp. TaxID=1506 RepID=UPI0026302FA5|nr:ABC transporter ATP-binding protein [Clostridium sp.]
MNSCQNKIDIKNIKKSFDSMKILEDISMEVKVGELVSILGPSGSGKSTIFNILTKTINSDEGTININGDISYMYQKDMMVPWKKVIDNIGIPLIFKGISKKKARKIVLENIKDFGLEGFEYKYPGKLSGGMKQRANFFKTYLTSKDIMLLDEPFGALDSLTRSKMQTWLMDLRKKMNSTILFITHDIEEAILLSDKIYILSEKPSIIKGEVIVKLPKDRNGEIVTSEEFIKIKKEIIKLI